MSWSRLGRHKNVTLKTSSRRLQDVFSTSSPRRMFAGNILINNSYIDSFLSNEIKSVIDILERNKIKIQSTNSHLKKIPSNSVTSNPTTTINNTNNFSGNQITPERKEMGNLAKQTEENNNLLDPKEKKMEVTKTQSQNEENELYEIG